VLKKVGWALMTLLACAVAVYAASAVVSPAARSTFVAALFGRTPRSALGHLTGGMVAIVAGALQVSSRIRARHLSFHRWLGRGYVIAVGVGGVGAFLLSLQSAGGGVTHFGFGLLAICWVASTLVGYRSIRAHDQNRHRAWMLRSYSLTLAAVTLRVYLPASLASGIPFDQAYPIIAWMCWVPNLIVVEWWILARRTRAPAIA